MGLEQTVTFAGTAPAWRDVHQLLTRRGFSVQMRMIDNQLAFPDEMPEEPWRELRVGTAAGMVTLRREADRVKLVTWGNADGPLMCARNAIAWALAEAGAGRIQVAQGEQTAAEFLGKPSQMNAVCAQSEWQAIESARPGYHTLILAGIANEGEAERVARSTPHDQVIGTQGITTLAG